MRDEPNLLAGIRANPDDDAPRLVYADWLDEDGQSDRAEFIRVQVALARTPTWSPNHPALARRSQDLIAEYQLQWAKSVLDAGAAQWEFRRGFLESVTLTPEQLLRAGERLHRDSMLQTLELNGEGDFARLFKEQPLGHWRELQFVNVGSDEICELLAVQARPMQTESLDFFGTELSDDGLELLCRTRALPNLCKLNLGENDLTEDSFELFAEASFTPQLRSLNVTDVWLDEAGLATIPFQRLEQLALSVEHVQELAERAAYGTPPIPLLEHLRCIIIRTAGRENIDFDWRFLLNYLQLQRFVMDTGNIRGQRLRQALETLARRPTQHIVVDEKLLSDGGFRNWLPELEDGTFAFHFKAVDDCDIGAWLSSQGYMAPEAKVTLRARGEQATPVVGKWPSLPQGGWTYAIELEAENKNKAPLLAFQQCVFNRHNPTLSDADIDGYNPIAVCEARRQYAACDAFLAWSELLRPHLWDDGRGLFLWAQRKINDALLQEITSSPALANIRELDLGGTSITLKGVQALIESPYIERLRYLRLSFNELGDGLAEMLADAPNLRRLATLKLSFCNIGDLGVRALAKSPYLTRLTTLKLWQGTIGNTGAKAIAQSETLACLRGLRLRNNAIEDTGALALAESPHFRWLRELDIMGNPIGDDGMLALNERYGGKLGYAIGDFEDFGT